MGSESIDFVRNSDKISKGQNQLTLTPLIQFLTPLKAPLILALIAILSGCSGWHLRGSNTGEAFDQTVFITGVNSPSYSATRDLLNARQALSTAASANYRLVLAKEQWQARTVSTGSQGLAAETELSLVVPYQVFQSTADIAETDSTKSTAKKVADTSIRLNRSYTADNNDIGAKNKERAELERDMSQAAAQAILRHLQLIRQQN